MTTTPRPELGQLVDDIAAITDPVARFKATRTLIDELTATLGLVKDVGKGAAQELRTGRTLREVGELLDISTARVDQVLKGR